ncbi:MAG: hypothetical protein ACOC1K_04890 [Nanoarchaeota archaeon]
MENFIKEINARLNQEDENSVIKEPIEKMETFNHELSPKYNSKQVIINDKISYYQITNFVDENGNEIKYDENAWIENALRNMRGYAKQEKDLIEKEQKTIVYMDQQEALSLHQLKENELKDKLRIYEIKLKKAV